MTLEELKNKVVNIYVNKDIVVGEDLDEDDLEGLLLEQRNSNISDEELLKTLLYNYYTWVDLVDYDEYILTVR